MSVPQIAQLDAQLADPKEREEMTDRQNAEAMKALGQHGMIMPPKGPPRKKTE